MRDRRNSNRRNRNRSEGNRNLHDDDGGQGPPKQPPGGNGGVDGGGNKGQGDPPSTKAEKVISGFTAALFFAAVVQAAVSWGQWKVAQRALWDAQTPHIRLWINGGGVRLSGLVLPQEAHIQNTGQTTLFNGRVWTRAAFVPADKPMAVWNRLDFRDEVVMGPEDTEDFPFAAMQMNPSQRERYLNGEGAVLMTIKIEYPDAAGRIHKRYYCHRWQLSDGGAGACATPPQS